jgi:hypothetical protein
MTMHLVGPYLTTTRYNQKKSNRKKSARQIKSEAEHNKFLRKMGIDPDATRSVKCYGSTSDSKPESRGSTPRTDAKFATSDRIPTGVAVKPKPKVYSGKQVLLGIATMHKSNMVPVFSKQNATDIAKMRR